jgi:hypothetical protein
MWLPRCLSVRVDLQAAGLLAQSWLALLPPRGSRPGCLQQGTLTPSTEAGELFVQLQVCPTPVAEVQAAKGEVKDRGMRHAGGHDGSASPTQEAGEPEKSFRWPHDAVELHPPARALCLVRLQRLLPSRLVEEIEDRRDPRAVGARVLRLWRPKYHRRTSNSDSTAGPASPRSGGSTVGTVVAGTPECRGHPASRMYVSAWPR